MDIWKRLLQRTDIGIHDDFFEAGGDSLLATQMLLEVEAAVGSRVPQSALVEASTIRQLATIATAGSDDDELVTKAKDGVGTPFFFCHGDFVTRGFYAIKLAALLESNQPVYLIQPLRDVDDSSELAIEDMARSHVPRLLELQPHGKFQLGGYCNGGLLAWEIAHQLRQAGREVESLVLIDAFSLNSRPLFRVIHRMLKRLAAMMPGMAQKMQLQRDGMRAIWNVTQTIGGKQVRMDCRVHSSPPAPSRATKFCYEPARNRRLMDLVLVTSVRWRTTFLQSSIATCLPSVANTKRTFLNGRPSRGPNWRAKCVAPLFPVSISPVLQLTLKYWHVY